MRSVSFPRPQIGLSLGWVYLFMGIAIGGAVAPIYCCLVWSKANATGAITGAISGTLLGLMAWLVTCQGYYGAPAVLLHSWCTLCCSLHRPDRVPLPQTPCDHTLLPRACLHSPPLTLDTTPFAGSINVDNLGGDYPMLAGNLTSICSSLIILTVFSLWKPQKYDWQTTREIPMVDEDPSSHAPMTGED